MKPIALLVGSMLAAGALDLLIEGYDLLLGVAVGVTSCVIGLKFFDLR